MTDFHVGDVVRLKSGGPIMTISSELDAMGYINCNWFAGAKLQSGRFRLDVLERVEDEPEGDK
jgi:uncharacterized protein YodC (DUF2158 family)